MATCYLVLGNPRSGTSCTAGILHRLGVRMSLGDFVEPTPANPTGFYEDPEMNKALGGVGFGRELYLHERHALLAKMRRAIDERCSPGIDWGCKTYRLAFVLQDFIDLCPMPVKILRTERNIASSRASWLRAFGGNGNLVDAVHASIAGVKGFTIRYDDLVASPRAGVQAIADFVGRPISEDAVSFVDATLRNFQ